MSLDWRWRRWWLHIDISWNRERKIVSLSLYQMSATPIKDRRLQKEDA